MVATISAASPVLVDYTLAILPGLLLITACFWLSRADINLLLRIIILMLGFVLIREAMTPAGLWDFGVVDGVVPWIRMTDNTLSLFALGITILLLVAATLSDKSLRTLVWWGKPNVSTLLTSLGGAILVVVPIFVLPADQPIETRCGQSR